MKNAYTIGLIADTHDVQNPAQLVDRLARQSCDYNVHLGDIGGSQIVMRVVRQFKHHLGDVDHLPPREHERFLAALAGGSSRLSAYIEACIDPDMISDRRAETAAAYTAVLSRMSVLSNPLILKGNVDGLQLQSPHVQQALKQSALRLIVRPHIVDLGWLGLVLWPSWRPATPVERAELDSIVAEFAARLAGKERVVFLAHEHCFKGPTTAVYTDRVARAGLQQISAPRFGPSATWGWLLRLFRALGEETSVNYIFGHIHDSDAVIRRGVPALRNPAGPGLRYRLYGLGWRGNRSSSRTANAEITMLPVGIDEVCVLGLRQGSSTVSWRPIVAPQRPA